MPFIRIFNRIRCHFLASAIRRSAAFLGETHAAPTVVWQAEPVQSNECKHNQSVIRIYKKTIYLYGYYDQPGKPFCCYEYSSLSTFLRLLFKNSIESAAIGHVASNIEFQQSTKALEQGLKNEMDHLNDYIEKTNRMSDIIFDAFDQLISAHYYSFVQLVIFGRTSGIRRHPLNALYGEWREYNDYWTITPSKIRLESCGTIRDYQYSVLRTDTNMVKVEMSVIGSISDGEIRTFYFQDEDSLVHRRFGKSVSIWTREA